MTAAAALLAPLLILAVFPWGILQNVLADRLAERFGRPVDIGSLERVDRFGFTPTVVLRDVRIRQADWAGTGDLLRIREARVTFPVWPLLIGSFKPRELALSGLRLSIVRAKDGRTNWPGSSKADGGDSRTDLKGLTVRDSSISYRDAKRDRQADLAFASDARGLRASGTGAIRGTPIRIALIGSSIAQPRPGPWPFQARISGVALTMDARGTMDVPLDTDRMTIDLVTRAADLKLIDAVIEAGLFGTQPVALSAHLRHDAPDWTITDLKGIIGRSDVAGHLTVKKRKGRTKLDGAIASRRFDFDDLSSDEGLARGRALESRIGPRIVPDTRINLAKIDSTDGTLAVRVDRVTSRTGDTSITGLNGRLELDHQRLAIAPLTINLDGGVAKGRAIVDQRRGAAHPTLTLDLTMRHSRMKLLAGAGGDVSGRIQAHGRLTGRGDTIRQAIGRSSGRIGFVVRGGALPARYAAALGFDAAGALMGKSNARATLRCLIIDMPVSGGRGTMQPLIVDTSVSRLAGVGSIQFPSERIAIRLTGAPKRRSLLRLPGEAYLTGSLSAPRLAVPRQVKSVGNIFKAIGRAIAGRQGPLALDADCAGLSTRALR